jgi:branched-subunit amino acid aminotransferase/4-amino-4-deoxychorismate lyase
MRGITRGNILKICANAGIPYRETDIGLTQVTHVVFGTFLFHSFSRK